jgi:TP901 family phage tail tape measure protein
VATVADLFVRVSADIRGLQTGLTAAKGNIAAFDRATQASAKGTASAFKGSQVAVVGALALGAAAAVKTALEFEESFTRISAISNSSAADVVRWKGEVLDLSRETARAPKELADALFFLSSAGLDSAQVMDALEVSAKAAASGLGSTVDVANIVASAMNAYADSALTAAQVTDTLVAAVREGRAEPEEFAGALGRILPIAVQAGVTFQDVTASLAGLSNVGLDVDEAVTAMRGVLQAVVAPGAQAAEAMDSLGLSAQQLLDSISEDGLVGALRLLDQRAKATTDTQADYIGVLRKVIPNVRALTGVLGLTGQEAAKLDRIVNNVRHSTGSLGEAMKTTAESDAFKLAQAMNDLQVTSLELASVAIPLIVAVMSDLRDVVEEIVGPLEFVAEQLDRLGDRSDDAGVSVASLSARVRDYMLLPFTGSLKLANDAIDVFTTSAEEAAAMVKNQTKAQRDAAFEAQRLAGAWREGGRSASVLASDVIRTAAAHREATAAAREQRNAELALAGGFLGLIGQANELQSAQADLTKLFEHGRQGTERYREASLRLLDAGISLKQGIVDYAKELNEAGATNQDVVRRVKELAGEFGLQGGDVRDLIGDVRDLLGRYGEFPSRVDTRVNADTSQARTALSNVAETLAGLTDNPYTVFINIKRGGDTIPTPHAGGPIHRGGPASIAGRLHRMHSGGPALAANEVLAVLKRGEYVINDRSAARIGGPALDMLNRMHAGGPAVPAISHGTAPPAADEGRRLKDADQVARGIGREVGAMVLEGLARARVQIDGRDAGRLLIPELERFKRLRDSR